MKKQRLTDSKPIILIATIVLAFILGNFLPRLGGIFSNFTFFDYFSILFFTVLAVFAVFIREGENFSSLVRITIFLFPVIDVVATFFLSDKTASIIYIVYGVLSFIIFVFFIATRGKTNTSAIIFSMGALIRASLTLHHMHLLNTGIPFFLPLIIISIVSLVVALFFYLKFNKNTNFIRIVLSSIFIAFLFSVFSFISLKSVNYAFDFSSPTAEVFTITDKKEVFNYRAEEKELHVQSGDKKLILAVTDYEFEIVSIGDEITIYFYDGALGENYYVFQILNAK